MKKFKIIAAFAGLLLGLIGIAGYANANGGFSTRTIDKTKTLDVKDINSIQFDSSLAGIRLYPVDSDVIKVHLHGGTSRKNILFTAKAEGDTAYIEIGNQEKRKINLFPFDFLGNYLKVEIEVPRKVYNQITIHSSAGNMNLKQIEAESFDLHSSAGSIYAENLKGDIKAHASAGSMKLIHNEGELNLTDSAGSIEVQLKAIEHNINAKSSAGSVRIETKEDPEAVQLNLHASAGKADVNLTGVSYSTKQNDHIVGSIGSGGPTVDLESSAGSVSIQKK